ncbi:MAG: hypothetical protein EOP06_02720 [Proteobacteria bacterium]|nr:MAG: hypothetical protein EOP06_02720 [Pseudomonadota bacterium]
MMKIAVSYRLHSDIKIEEADSLRAVSECSCPAQAMSFFNQILESICEDFSLSSPDINFVNEVGHSVAWFIADLTDLDIFAEFEAMKLSDVFSDVDQSFFDQLIDSPAILKVRVEVYGQNDDLYALSRLVSEHY